MPFYGRHSVLSGQALDLRVIFRDDANCLIDPDALPDVYIYDESVDTDVIDAEILAAVFTNALSGPLVPTKLSTGFYTYNYTVPSSSTAGIWHDVWISQVDTVNSDSRFAFTVDTAANLSLQSLQQNELILICLDATIGNLAATQTLGADTQLSFSTVYSPLYASPDLLRMEVGTFIDYIPDDTLALMIHWSSKEADFIRRPSLCNNTDYEFARTKFVVFDAALRALTLPGGSTGSGAGSSSSAAKKTLGDLSITSGNSGSTLAVTSGGVDLETLGYIREQRNEWWRVVNSGACIVPGQSFDPETAIRSKFDPDRRASGRLWMNPEYSAYSQPGANTKVRIAGRQRSRYGFADHRRSSPRRRF